MIVLKASAWPVVSPILSTPQTCPGVPPISKLLLAASLKVVRFIDEVIK